MDSPKDPLEKGTNFADKIISIVRSATEDAQIWGQEISDYDSEETDEEDEDEI